MIESTKETIGQLRAAVRTVLKTYDDPKAAVNPPCAIVGAPELDLEGISSAPTRVRVPVLVMVKDDKTAIDKLIELVPQVVQAIRDLVEDAEINDPAVPAAVEIGGVELPGYVIMVEV